MTIQMMILRNSLRNNTAAQKKKPRFPNENGAAYFAVE